MQKVYFMIGVPGAGKTTYATTELSHAVYLGTDAIRKELFGKELTLRGHRKFISCYISDYSLRSLQGRML